MNLLKGTNCYTIGQLQYGCFEEARKWRGKPLDPLRERGVNIISPLDKFLLNYPKEDPNFQEKAKNLIRNGYYEEARQLVKPVRRRDLAAVDLSTFLIAIIDTSKHTCGAYEEIFTAAKANKPIFCIFTGEKKGIENVPLWMWGVIPHEFFYSTLGRVVQDLLLIDEGKKKIDPKYWKILTNGREV